jgi:hypothetical protein
VGDDTTTPFLLRSTNMTEFTAFLAGVALMAYVLLAWTYCKAVWNGDWTGAATCALSLLALL